MNKIATPEELARYVSQLRAREAAGGRTINICGGVACEARGSRDVFAAFAQAIAERGVGAGVRLRRTGCPGFCAQGPAVLILPERFFYPRVRVEDVPEILERTALGGEVVEHLLYTDPVSGEKVPYDYQLPFYRRQTRVVLRFSGELDPLSLDDYLLRDGYAALAKALTAMTPAQVIEQVTRAGLRGRGGAGFPTGRKWELCRAQPATPKYFICNAHEGDPGVFKDRSLLGSNPHLVLEGMIIAAYAVGAREGIIYLHAEQPSVLESVQRALADACQAGFLGENILGSDFSFTVSVFEGGGAFVCGEEGALLASLEGGRGMPSPRPPFPAEQGYRGQPTAINNVETLATVPAIILHGPEWYAALGTATSKGTKIFCLAGRVNHPGLVEVPLGTTLREMVFGLGGGLPAGRTFKAVHVGSSSGGCLPAPFLDLPVDYESLRDVGAALGSGELLVLDEQTCMVDLARYFLQFSQAESCGKCVPCRLGTRRMLEILTRITAGRGTPADLQELEDLADLVKSTSLCGLGQTAPNPVLATLRYFREEYEEHIYLGHCRAGVCAPLVRAPCQHVCPARVNAAECMGLVAEGRWAEAAELVRRRNPFLGVCGRLCHHPCESRCRRADWDAPLAIRAVERHLADHASPAPVSRPVPRGEAEVAIVGAGPAGLSCAYFLALLGRRAVVFEQLPFPGGMLAVAIPQYRLPRDVLQRDLDYLLAHDIELRLQTRVESLEELRANYRAVFVATGAQHSQPLQLPGADLPGVVDGLAFLRQCALGQPPACEGRVVVIGGGLLALDAARSALRLGAEQVVLLYAGTREEMPAPEEHVVEALREGVDIQCLLVPTRLVAAQGRLGGVEVVRRASSLQKDNGEWRRPLEGRQFVLACDMVIAALGRRAAVEIAGPLAADLVRQGCFQVNAVSLATPVPGVFAGGDCVAGRDSVVQAVGDGQRAALAIDRLLGGRGELPQDRGFSFRRPADEDLRPQPRATPSQLPPQARLTSFAEVLLGLSDAEVCSEAGRCLRCDLEPRRA
jgi:NADH-quinone oxidoreductase subunit F